MSKWIFSLTWAWMIIIGILMITPGGVFCLACSPSLLAGIGVITIILGLVGIGMAWKQMKKMPAEKPAAK
jgi:hypothetical protein